MVYGFMMRHVESSSLSDVASISKKRLELMSLASIATYQPKHLLLASMCILENFIQYENFFTHLWSGFLNFLSAFLTMNLEGNEQVL